MNTSSFIGSPLSTPVGRNMFRNTPSTARQSMKAEVALEENGLCVLKAKNSPVPVQVQELLRNHSQRLSLKLDPSGWAWIVSSHIAFMWKFVPSQSTSCLRVALPHSNDPNTAAAAWSAGLLAVSTIPSGVATHIIVGVSSDGHVFFWKSNAVDVSFKEVRLRFTGTNTTSLAICYLEQSKSFAILASDGTMYIVNHTSQSVLTLEPPKGMLSGIGKRFSLFLFGDQGANREPVRLLSVPSIDNGPDRICVLTKSNLQMWRINSIAADNQQMQYDVDISLMIRDGLLSQNWFDCNDDDSESVAVDDINVWLMDCQLSINGIVILFAASLKNGSTGRKYGLVLVPNDSDSVPYSCDQFIDLSLTEPDSDTLVLELQGCQAHSQAAVFCSRFLVPVQLNRFVNGGEPAEVPSIFQGKINMESIIGSGIHQNELLFFTRDHGIVSLTVHELTDVTPKKRTKTYSSSIAAANKAVPRFTQPPAMHLNDLYLQETDELKNAFMLYLSNDLSKACNVCSRVFPNQSFASSINTPGDVSVMRLSEMVLNDAPVADPRWGDVSSNLSDSFSSSSSLIIIHQLEDKREAHTRFVQFLSDVDLLDRLTCIAVRDKTMKTCDLLCEHAEKIVATIGLKKSMNHVIDNAIRRVLKERPPRPHLPAGLTPQDIYFSQVACIEDVFEYLVDSQADGIATLTDSASKFQVVLGVSTALQNLFNEAIQHRQSRGSFYEGMNTKEIITEYTPWTASTGKTGGRTVLIEQLNCLIDVWEDSASDPVRDHDKQIFWNSFCLLSKHLFHGFQSQLDSIRDHSDFKDIYVNVMEEFNEMRDTYIGFLFDNGRIVASVELAEDFHHFHTLIRLCDVQQDRLLLKAYFEQFKDFDFGDFLFQYYMNSGNLKSLLSFSDIFPNELETFLKPHNHLLWIHYLATQEYCKAADCLVVLGSDEAKSVAKKKTMLSIAKLSLLAESKDGAIDSEPGKEINRQLKHIKHQEQALQWSEEVNTEDVTRPLEPDEIVEFYIDNDNAGIDQYLCALDFVLTTLENDSEVYTDMLMEIWSRAILRNDWDTLGTDDALKSLQSTFFMNVVTKGIEDELDITSLLPDVDDLLQCDALADIANNSTTLNFLIKAAYEHIDTLQ